MVRPLDASGRRLAGDLAVDRVAHGERGHTGVVGGRRVGSVFDVPSGGTVTIDQQAASRPIAGTGPASDVEVRCGWSCD